MKSFFKYSIVMFLSIMMLSLSFVNLSQAKITEVDLSSAVGIWLFDEGSGDSAKDISSKGNHAKLTKNPKWISGKFGKALEFNGKDNCVQTEKKLLDNLTEFSIMFWMKTGKITGTRIGLVGQNNSPEFGFENPNTLWLWTPAGDLKAPWKQGQPSKKIEWEKDNSQMALIPAGSFKMGDHFNEGANDGRELPVHTVQLDAFYMDVHEVTVGQFREFVNQSGYSYNRWNDVAENSPGDGYPMVLVNWPDATAYAKWAGKRLPTEAEWEYAARGGLVGKRYPWGDDENVARDHANYDGTGGKDKWSKCSLVGSFAANGYGLYDMAGNVREWCQDWYGKNYYSSSPAKNPLGPGTGSLRVLRGGGWYDKFGLLRVAYRAKDAPIRHRGINLGFRCVSGSNFTSGASVGGDFTSDEGWHHIAGVASKKEMKIYIDGKVASKGNGGGPFGSSPFNVNVGGCGIWDAAGNWFTGAMDEVAIFHNALDDAAINKIMKSGFKAMTTAVDPKNRLAITWGQIKKP